MTARAKQKPEDQPVFSETEVNAKCALARAMGEEDAYRQAINLLRDVAGQYFASRDDYSAELLREMAEKLGPCQAKARKTADSWRKELGYV